MLTLARQPYKLVEHRVRNAIRAWSMILTLVATLVMSAIAAMFFVCSVTSLTICCFGYWTSIFPALLFMWLTRIIVEQLQNSLESLVKLIAEIAYLAIPVALLASCFWMLLHFGIVTKNHLQVLKFASWFLPPVIYDSLNGVSHLFHSHSLMIIMSDKIFTVVLAQEH